MAEAVLKIVAEAALNKVTALASEQLSSFRGFEDDLKRLAQTLNTIQKLLSDADKKQIGESSVHQWLTDLSSVASNADEVLDEYGYEVLHRKVLESQKYKLNMVRYFCSSSNPLRVRRVLSRKIKKVNSELENLYEIANKIGLRVGLEQFHTSTQLIPTRITGPSVDESMVVGREDDVITVVEMLESSTSKQLDVIAIVGLGGVGKTTLAQVVYKNERVESLFDHKMWICVSDDFNVERILKEMMQCLKLDRSNKLSNRGEIVEEIKRALNGKNYLLVLDDVWNEDHEVWEPMRSCLTNVGSHAGNKVLVTTRSHAVVAAMKSSECLSLQELSEDRSWELFSKIAFAEGGPKETNKMKSIGEKMLKNCGRIPLAIKTLADLMWKIDENEWPIMEENIRKGIRSSEDKLTSTLRLSYDHLSSLPLKQCFAYCSIFKKDTFLEREKVIQLWMAQALLKPIEGNQDSAHLEYLVGDNYFDVLMQKSFFDNFNRDDYGKVVSCKMHDLVHDLSLRISEGYCSTFLSKQENGSSKGIHLISNGKLISQFSHGEFSKLRTLYLVGRVGLVAPDFLVSLQSLRALILEDGECKELPHSIGKLKHLRFLDISKTSIEMLPNSICKLYYLQTLRLNYLKKLPPKFEKLVNLRYFYILGWFHEEQNCLLPKVGQFTYLQALPYFVVRPKIGCEIKELGALAYLKGKLKIFGLEHVSDDKEAKGADLLNKSSVDSLELYWSREVIANLDEDVHTDTNVLEGLEPHSHLKSLKVVNFKGSCLPSWMSNRSSLILQNLLKIQLSNFVKCEHVPALGCLPCLKIIGLYSLKNVKQIGNEFYGLTDSVVADATMGRSTIFPELKEIILEDMSSLEEWAVPSALPMNLFLKLEKFHVIRCPKLTCLPDTQNLCHLQEFEIFDCALKNLPAGLGSCISLRKMKIDDCINLTCLPDMKNLKLLQELEIYRCPALKHIHVGLGSCVYLKRMKIRGCMDLTCLPDMENLKHLHEFQIENCSALKNLPLGLDSCVMMKIQECHGLTCLPDMKNFKRLLEFKLGDCSTLKHLPDGLGSCVSLTALEISKCHSLLTVPDMNNLPSLLYLILVDCKSLNALPNGIESLPSLKELNLGGFSEELNSFPWASPAGIAPVEDGKPQHPYMSLAYFPALSCLQLRGFNGLYDLPEWICNIQTLRSLWLYQCQNLRHLSCLPNLEELDIYYCPYLVERCAQKSGLLWDNIKHVPNYIIEGTTTQGVWEHIHSKSLHSCDDQIESPIGKLMSKVTSCYKSN